MESSKKYSFYKKEKTDKVWWLDNYDTIGQFVFSFDRKVKYNLFSDYPFKLSVREWMIFNAENEYWKEFFADRNEEYEIEHYKEINEINNSKADK